MGVSQQRDKKQVSWAQWVVKNTSTFSQKGRTDRFKAQWRVKEKEKSPVLLVAHEARNGNMGGVDKSSNSEVLSVQQQSSVCSSEAGEEDLGTSPRSEGGGSGCVDDDDTPQEEDKHVPENVVEELIEAAGKQNYCKMAELVANNPSVVQLVETITPLWIQQEEEEAEKLRQTLSIKQEEAVKTITELDTNMAEYEQMRTRANVCTDQRRSRKEGAKMLREIETKLATCQGERKELIEASTEYKRLAARASLRVTLIRELASVVASGDTKRTQVVVERLNKTMTPQ